MKRIYNTINEEVNRIKSLFTEERLYGGLVEQFGDDEKDAALSASTKERDISQEEDAKKEKEVKGRIEKCNSKLLNYEKTFFNVIPNKRVDISKLGETRVKEELGKLKKCTDEFWNDTEKVLKVGSWGGNDINQMITLITSIMEEGNTDYLSWDLEKITGLSSPFKLLSDKLEQRIKDGPLDPIKNKKKSLKQEADTSFQACKSQLGKINKSLKKDGLTIDQYVEEYGDTLMGADGNPIEGLTSDILGGMVKGCLTKHHSTLGIIWDAVTNKYSGMNKLGNAVENIIDEWKIKFDKQSGGVMGTTYNIMLDNQILGKVKKTGRNMFAAQINKGLRNYAFIGGNLDKRYINLIKTAITTDQDLNIRKENDKSGVVTFSLV